MANYMPPRLDRPPTFGPKHNFPRFERILVIAMVVALVGFLAVLITAIVTAA